LEHSSAPPNCFANLICEHTSLTRGYTRETQEQGINILATAAGLLFANNENEGRSYGKVGNLQMLLNVICVKFQLCNGNNGLPFKFKIVFINLSWLSQDNFSTPMLANWAFGS
jgi:hypothetical protein